MAKVAGIHRGGKHCWGSSVVKASGNLLIYFSPMGGVMAWGISLVAGSSS